MTAKKKIPPDELAIAFIRLIELAEDYAIGNKSVTPKPDLGMRDSFLLVARKFSEAYGISAREIADATGGWLPSDTKCCELMESVMHQGNR